MVTIDVDRILTSTSHEPNLEERSSRQVGADFQDIYVADMNLSERILYFEYFSTTEIPKTPVEQ